MIQTMKKLIGTLLLAVMLSLAVCPGALALVERSPFLDAAFSAIEQDNIFQRRYNEITGAEVKSLFEQGVPYFFGRQTDYTGTKLTNVKDLMAAYPNYTIRKSLETTKFYRKDQFYIYGFDCSGFTRWIYHQCGLPMHPGLNDMNIKYEERVHHIYNGGTQWTSEAKPMPPYDELKDHLQVGDLLNTKHGARHIMMYIGTLRDYGFTAEEVPDLADYLDYPLVIHCGPSPFYGARFEKVIADNPELYGKCKTTNGGVEVSILGVPVNAFPYHEHVQITDFDYFLIDDGNYMLTLRDIDEASSFCWYRM